MSQPAKLRVLLKDHEIRKLDLPNGIPETVESLVSLVKETFALDGLFILHYKDVEFDEYFSLTSTCDIKDKDTVKVVPIVEPPTVTLTFTDLDTSADTFSDAAMPSPTPSSHASVSSTYPSSNCSFSSQDTVILSSPEHRSQRWPIEFQVPTFAFDTELVLAAGNEAFINNGTPLNFTKFKGVLDRLAEAIFSHVAYPNGAQLLDVADALTTKHPCLKEPVAHKGNDAWLKRLKYKMTSYRSKLRGIGCPELTVNAVPNKRPSDKAPAKNIKKTKKAEVNYLPPHPKGMPKDSLEQVRVELLEEVKKRNNNQTINEKMLQTFSLRRQEVVTEDPPIRDLKERWPAVFIPSQINEEFKRITTVNLEAQFMEKLDKCTSSIITMAQSRGGAARRKLQQLRDKFLQNEAIEGRREFVIRAIMILLREKEEDLFSEQSEESGNIATQSTTQNAMKILVSREESTMATIIIEETAVLEVPDVARACALLMGLIYAVNLSYPKKLQNTFEVFQKVFLNLDSLKLSPKVMSLRSKLMF